MGFRFRFAALIFLGLLSLSCSGNRSTDAVSGEGSGSQGSNDGGNEKGTPSGKSGDCNPDLVTATDSAALNASPVTVNQLLEVIPLGNLSPTAHTFPTDHTYFQYNSSPPSAGNRVYAPGTGVVSNVRSQPEQGGPSYAVWVQMSKTICCQENAPSKKNI